MKPSNAELALLALGYKHYTYKGREYIVEYINESNGNEIQYNLITKSVRLNRHLMGRDEPFSCQYETLDIIKQKMIELLQERKYI
jgi:hypothetical protein